MVLLTMTPSIVAGLKVLEGLSIPDGDGGFDASLTEPAVGKPISHGQIVDAWKLLRQSERAEYSLETLLRGSRVYVPPPPPKPEPTKEYKALMARLRREEEQRSYERMTAGPPRMEAFREQFPNASFPMARAFASVNKPHQQSDLGDGEVEFADVNRQLTLIVNFLVSIFGCAVTIWFAARWWSLPARIFLTLGGSIVVAIAEVVVYSGFIRRIGEGKAKRERVREVKEVVNTWVVEDEKAGSIGVGDLPGATSTDLKEKTAVRRRPKEATSD